MTRWSRVMNRCLRPWVVVWLAALLWLAALFCLPAASWAGPDERLTVTDLAGRKVEVPQNPARILCLGPGCLRLIVYLQAQGKLAGIEELEARYPGGRPYFMAHPELGRLPVVTPGGVAGINRKPDLERVLVARPQVIFVTYMEAAVAEQVQRLLGVPVVVLAYGPLGSFDPQRVAASLRLAGRILNRAARAERVIEFVNAALADLAARAARSGRPPSVYVGGLGFKGAHGLESSNADYLPFTWLGLKNAAGEPGDRGRLMVAKERLLALNPEVIFIDGGGMVLVEADYTKRTGYYHGLTAFNKGRVHMLHPYNWYTTNLGTALADAYAIGAIIHPAGFGDIDPARRADAIYKFLVGRPIHSAMVKRYGELGARPNFLKEAKP